MLALAVPDSVGPCRLNDNRGELVRMAITERETGQIDEANASGRPALVLIHGLWLLPSSWDRWSAVAGEAGYAALTPSWPDDPETVEEARANPQVFAKKTVGQVADHIAEVIGKLTGKPAVIGHSFGGLLAQIIAGRGLSAASVAIHPPPLPGGLPPPVSPPAPATAAPASPAHPAPPVHPTAGHFKY